MPKEDPFVNRAQLLKAIKKYPEIWDSNNKLHMCRSVTAPLWNEIAEQFGGHVPTVKLQSIWSQMKYHYHNLVHRQILHKERFTTKWEHFEPMSFMYNITVAKIVGSATGNGGESNQGNSTTTGGGGAVQVTTSSANVTTTTTVSPQATTHHQGRGRPSGSFTSWLPPAPPPLPTSATVQQQQQLQHLQVQTQLSESPATGNHHGRAHEHLQSLHSGIETTTAHFTAFTGLVPPAAVTIETTTTPPPPPTPILRKPGRPGSLNNSMRGRIIDAIKAHPVLWAGRQREPQPRVAGQSPAQNRTSALWKEIAAELGLTPSLVQTRWSIIKQRYVDELQKERHTQYTQQGFRSTWEHFDRMEFMREILTKKVDEREQTREHIQEIVSEQQQQQQHQQQHQQQQQQRQQQQQHQQQHQQQQQQQHSQQQHPHHLLRYNGRHHPALQHPAMMMSGLVAGLPPGVSHSGLAAAAAAAAASGQHPLSTICDDMHGPVGVGVGVPGIGVVGAGGVDVGSMIPMHHLSAGVGGVGVGVGMGVGVGGVGFGRRRVKTESDLEWDPFEMILQVHGTEPAAN